MSPQPRAPQAPTIVLPTEKTTPGLSIETAKGLLHGHPKVGKSTLLAELSDRALFLATEAGLGAISAYALAIGSWDEFRAVGPQLKAQKDAGTLAFDIVVIDTADMLAKFCSDKVCSDLGIKHPSDLDYGKGWSAVTDEFRLRVAALSALGLGVWFISHSKDVELKTRTGTKIKTQPSLSGGMRDFLTGFVDVILYAAIEDDGEGGERRVLHTQPTENIEAGQRVPRDKPPLPDVLPLDAGALREAFSKAWGSEPAVPAKTEKAKSSQPAAASTGDKTDQAQA